jgi:signal transduction histidine kinase
MQAQQCSVWLFEPEEQVLRLKAAEGYRSLATNMYPTMVYSVREGSDPDGTTAWIFMNQQAVTADTYRELSQKKGYRGRFDKELHGLINDKGEIDYCRHPCQQFYGAPITLGNDRIGVLKVENKLVADSSGRKRFTDTEKAALETIAATLALALKHTRASKDEHDKRYAYYRTTLHSIRNELFPITDGARELLRELREGKKAARDNLGWTLDTLDDFLHLGIDGVDFYLRNLLKFIAGQVDRHPENFAALLDVEVVLLRKVASDYLDVECSVTDADYLKQVPIDKDFIAAVVKELFRNARKAVYERREEAIIRHEPYRKGRIALSVTIVGRGRSKMVELTVGDDGIGTVDQTRKEHLRQAFSDARPFKAGQLLGREHTHLGLAFIKEVVDKHLGTVVLDVGDMTQFVIRLPLEKKGV